MPRRPTATPVENSLACSPMSYRRSVPADEQRPRGGVGGEPS
ncbi:hypothetical protein STRTUCAR8_09142 [Streptomyces turgidiscabies Car8]|uniref:Uncharacterized protein n=1 Tax=Streptomyces turgidiscabies (strain Car8) TaxID=698760 RepID=L7F7T4_STRT8|nr:hypothetical protein STRTUCAR8_09142 [Streptomyces turgidiscabies Car8]